VGDLNGDGSQDLATTEGVLLGRGDGTFAPPLPLDSMTIVEDVALADLNRDGNTDVVTAGTVGGMYCVDCIGVLLGRGDGTFQTPVAYATAHNPWSVRVADVNADGRPDVMTADRAADQLSVLLGRGDGSFGAHVDYPAGDDPVALAVGEFSGDTIPDIAVADWAGGQATVMAGLGTGTFAAPVTVLRGRVVTALAAADLNGDGLADLIGAMDDTVALLFNQSSTEVERDHAGPRPPAARTVLWLSASPTGSIVLTGSVARQGVLGGRIYDPVGRFVGRIRPVNVSPGHVNLTIDLELTRGERLRAGLYQAVLTLPPESFRARLVLVP